MLLSLVNGVVVAPDYRLKYRISNVSLLFKRPSNFSNYISSRQIRIRSSSRGPWTVAQLIICWIPLYFTILFHELFVNRTFESRFSFYIVLSVVLLSCFGICFPPVSVVFQYICTVTLPSWHWNESNSDRFSIPSDRRFLLKNEFVRFIRKITLCYDTAH